jgi:hypothetical protein
VYKHLNLLLDADLIARRQREGHKWVYYKLSWKGASLLHPETSSIRLAFTMSIALFAVGILSLIQYMSTFSQREAGLASEGVYAAPYLVMGIGCMLFFVCLLGVTIRKVRKLNLGR